VRDPAPDSQAVEVYTGSHEQRLADGEECLTAALDYQALGWSVLAVCPPDHCGVGTTHAQKCDSLGKAPWGPWKDFQDRPATVNELRQKWKDNPKLNVGLALGPVSGLVRVDVDGPSGEALLQEKSGGDLPVTLEFDSGRDNGGRGLLYAIPLGAQLRTTIDAHKKKEELRFQARGAQTVLPPSRHHPSGRKYRWKPGRSPWDIDPAPAPAWLLDALQEDRAEKGKPAHKFSETNGYQELTKPLESRVANYLACCDKAVSGERGHNKLLWAARCVVYGFNLGPSAGYDVLVEHYNPRCEPAWSEAELRHKCAEADTTPFDKPRGWLLADDDPTHETDRGNAIRLAARFGEDLRHCFPWRKWLVWDGTRWCPDDTGAATRHFKKVLVEMFREAVQVVKEIERQLGEEAGE
jgi:hypothetical protein